MICSKLFFVNFVPAELSMAALENKKQIKVIENVNLVVQVLLDTFLLLCTEFNKLVLKQLKLQNSV